MNVLSVTWIFAYPTRTAGWRFAVPTSEREAQRAEQVIREDVQRRLRGKA